MVNNWLNIIQHWLFPPTCILCGSAGETGRDLCGICRNQLPLNETSCRCCANALPTTEPGQLCGRCIAHPPAFDKTLAPFLYEDGMSYLVSGLKFGARHANARLLGQLLSDYAKRETQLPESLIPVPLYQARYRERGFNQALEIGRFVAAETGITLDWTSCRRRRDTARQTGLTAKQRRRNVKNAFALNATISSPHVAILDDVMTTGSTAHELAALLKSQGVERVDVWVCARA